MKTLLILIAFFNLSMVCKAQCQEKIEGVQLQKGMLMYTNPNIMLGDSRTFVAEIISVNGFEFTCRFLHSNSVYYFKNLKLAGGFSDTLMQATVVKSKGGPSLRIHHQDDEIFHVISGAFLFQINEKIFRSKKGDNVFVPKSTAHTYAKSYDKNLGELLIIHQPISPSLEKFYQVFFKNRIYE
ncbi:cupin domain-containing protein [Chryseobacterium sp. CBo1]|uniref:cupin domain-containing protein n=1 Tax=Chryseobacterium sp. CBo1 TaxID=1869230 RepID=UPI0013F4CD43|nr:cupin domain-containing protein [Chryseobacterium sp. CBo1]